MMNDKELLAFHAAQRVQSGMCVGLGTGTTANAFIVELARRQRDEGLVVTTVASSLASALRATESGLVVLALEHVATLDLYVDGADEFNDDKTLLKGKAADLVREKLLASAAARCVVVVEQSKHVARIGSRHPVPVEVMPFAWQIVQRHLERLGARAVLRRNAADGIAVTSHGSLVLDATFDATHTYSDKDLDDALNAIPGVVEHGVFVGLAHEVLVVDGGKVQVLGAVAEGVTP
jgi:ribose 5-phosphate isomerase A